MSAKHVINYFNRMCHYLHQQGVLINVSQSDVSIDCAVFLFFSDDAPTCPPSIRLSKVSHPNTPPINR